MKKISKKKITLIIILLVFSLLAISISIFLYTTYKYPILNEGYLYLKINSDYYEYDLKNKEYSKIDTGNVDYLSLVKFNNNYYSIKSEQINNSETIEKHIVCMTKNDEIKEFEVDLNVSEIIFVNGNNVIYKTYEEYGKDDSVNFYDCLYSLDINTGEIIKICKFYDSYYVNENNFYYSINNKIYFIDLCDKNYNQIFFANGKVIWTDRENMVYSYDDKLYEYDIEIEKSKKIHKLFFSQYKNQCSFKQNEFYVDNEKHIPFFYQLTLFSPREDEPEYSFEICLFNDLFIKHGNRIMRLKVNSNDLCVYWAECFGYSKNKLVL